MNEIQSILLECKNKKISKWKIKQIAHVSWHSVHMWEKGLYQPTTERLNNIKIFLSNFKKENL